MTLQTRVVRVQTLVIEVRRGDRSGVAFAVGSVERQERRKRRKRRRRKRRRRRILRPDRPNTFRLLRSFTVVHQHGRCLARAILSLVDVDVIDPIFRRLSLETRGRHRTSLEDARGDSSAAAASAATRISSWASPRRSTRGSNARRRRRRWSSASSRVETHGTELGSVPRGRRFGSATSNVQSSRTRAAASTSCSRRSATSAARRATSSASCRRSRRSTWRASRWASRWASRSGTSARARGRGATSPRGRRRRRRGRPRPGRAQGESPPPPAASPEARRASSARWRTRGGSGIGSGSVGGGAGNVDAGTRGARREDSTARGSSPRPSSSPVRVPLARNRARMDAAVSSSARATSSAGAPSRATSDITPRVRARASGDISDAQDHAPPDEVPNEARTRVSASTSPRRNRGDTEDGDAERRNRGRNMRSTTSAGYYYPYSRSRTGTRPSSRLARDGYGCRNLVSGAYEPPPSSACPSSSPSLTARPAPQEFPPRGANSPPPRRFPPARLSPPTAPSARSPRAPLSLPPRGPPLTVRWVTPHPHGVTERPRHQPTEPKRRVRVRDVRRAEQRRPSEGEPTPRREFERERVAARVGRRSRFQRASTHVDDGGVVPARVNAAAAPRTSPAIHRSRVARSVTVATRKASATTARSDPLETRENLGLVREGSRRRGRRRARREKRRKVQTRRAARRGRRRPRRRGSRKEGVPERASGGRPGCLERLGRLWRRRAGDGRARAVVSSSVRPQRTDSRSDSDPDDPDPDDPDRGDPDPDPPRLDARRRHRTPPFSARARSTRARHGRLERLHVLALARVRFGG